MAPQVRCRHIKGFLRWLGVRIPTCLVCTTLIQVRFGMIDKEIAKGSGALGGRPTAERAAEIGHAVISATKRVLGKHGADFSMDQVAALAGVSKQAIYRRWESKADLIVDTIDTILAETLIELNYNDDPVVALREAAWRLFDDGDQVGRYSIQVFLRAEGLFDADLKHRLLEFQKKYLDAYLVHLVAIERNNLLAEGGALYFGEILLDLLDGASSRLATLGTGTEEETRRVFEQRWQEFRKLAIKPAKSSS